MASAMVRDYTAAGRRLLLHIPLLALAQQMHFGPSAGRPPADRWFQQFLRGLHRGCAEHNEPRC